MTRFFLYISYMMVLTVSIYVILASIYHEKANDWVITGFNQTHRNIRSYINRTLTEQPVKEPKTVGGGKSVGDAKTVGNGKSVGDAKTVGDGKSVGGGKSVGDGKTVGDGKSVENMKIMICIPTYNRIGYTKFNAKIMREYHAIPSDMLYIFDDCSTEYGENELREWYGKDIHFFGCKNRLRSDGNIRRMFEYFVTTDFDLIFSVDTDLLFQKNWRVFIMKHMDSTDGVLSLYHSNAPHHKTFNCDKELCEKKSIGSAGIVMKKIVAKKMLRKNNNKLFDWGFVSVFKKLNIKMVVPKHSLIMHYGQFGQNNECGTKEVARGFNRGLLPKWINDGITFYFDKCTKHSIDIVNNSRRKYLLFTSAGDKHNVQQWLGENRMYDIAVMYYGDKDFDLPVDMLVNSKDTKFPNLYKWIIEKKMVLTDINEYNLIAVWDDDIVANVLDINKLFEEFDDHDASIYSPCHTRGSYPSLFKQRVSGLRKVDFVEMNAPIFKPAFLLKFMENFDTNLKGWGTDIWYSQQCSIDCNIIVSDTTCVTNPKTRADGTREIEKAQSEHDRSTYWKNLAKRKKINPNVPSSAYQQKIIQYENKKNTLKKIINGIWKTIDLTSTNNLIQKLNKHINKNTDEKLEGGTFKYKEKRQLYIALSKLENIKHICEIGFNGGHSALLWLHTNENAKVTMFDIWEHKYAEKGLEFLKTTKQLKNVDKRLTIMKGSSFDTVKNYDGDLCDILSIDGDHSYTGALTDLINMRKHVRDNKSIILIDDTGCDKSFTWCIPVDKALNEVIQKKIYKLIYFVKSGGSGVSVLMKK